MIVQVLLSVIALIASCFCHIVVRRTGSVIFDCFCGRNEEFDGEEEVGEEENDDGENQETHEKHQ